MGIQRPEVRTRKDKIGTRIVVVGLALNGASQSGYTV